MSTRSAFLFAASACWCSAALAFIDPPRIAPPQPTTESFVTMTIRTGFCDVFTTEGPNDRELEIIGSRVIIIAEGFSTEDLAQCIFGIREFTYNIGQLPAGSYTLEVFQRDLFVPSQVRLVGSAPFSVLPVDAVAIPAMDAWPLAGLMLLCAALGMAALRRGA